jgi:hypothetical protein
MSSKHRSAKQIEETSCVARSAARTLETSRLPSRSARSGVLALLCVAVPVLTALPSCSISSKFGPSEGDKLRERLGDIQQAACLRAPTWNGCDPSLAASFQSPNERVTASVWCEGGIARGRFVTDQGEVTGIIGPVAWEAIWRTIDATESCASAYDVPVRITRNGETTSCVTARFDIRRLFDIAYMLAKGARPREVEGGGPGALVKTVCDVDPSLCTKRAEPCPLFKGDPWGGASPQSVAAPFVDAGTDGG